MVMLSIKKIVFTFTVIFSLGIFGIAPALANCQGSQAICANLSQSQCSTGAAYYEVQTSNPNTETTYCTQCSACIAGMSDCVKGALGCNSCQISTGGSSGTGYQCVSAYGACTTGGSECNWSD
jgi:hypothetical protein